jgi:SAM-dependent methyltransferase
MIDNLKSYSVFAEYYQSLINHRDHAGPIARLLKELLLPSHRKLLDAACGQGNRSYFEILPGMSIFASDGSEQMLERLKADKALFSKYEQVAENQWEDLPGFFLKWGKFDAIFFLGNSISHASDLDDIENTFYSCIEGLEGAGRLIIDMRRWHMDDMRGHLIEPGRVEGKRRLLLQETSNGSQVSIFDFCSYDSGRQIIDYFIEKDGEPIASVGFSYLMVSPSVVASMLRKAGFRVVFEGSPDYYPYYVLSGEK